MLEGIFLNVFLTKQHLNMFKRWCERGISHPKLSLGLAHVKYKPKTVLITSHFSSLRRNKNGTQESSGSLS